MNETAELMLSSFKMSFGALVLGGLVLGVALFFGGMWCQGTMQADKTCVEACAPSQSKEIEGRCHCESESGWRTAR